MILRDLTWNLPKCEVWTISSVGQSNRLIIGRSWVRVPDGPRMAIWHFPGKWKLHQDRPDEVRWLSAPMQNRNGMSSA